MKMITYKNTSTDKELLEILDLQQQNLPKSTSEQERKTQGFVTVEHDFDILKKMHDVYPHTIAVSNGKVVGYVLSMAVCFGQSIPVLQPMFDEFKKHHLTEDFIVMGQVCISKTYRGKGVFRSLYQKMSETFSNTYHSIITEVDKLNTRSLNAHYSVGFKDVCEYEAGGQLWKIISWEI